MILNLNLILMKLLCAVSTPCRYQDGLPSVHPYGHMGFMKMLKQQSVSHMPVCRYLIQMCICVCIHVDKSGGAAEAEASGGAVCSAAGNRC